MMGAAGGPTLLIAGGAWDQSPTLTLRELAW